MMGAMTGMMMPTASILIKVVSKIGGRYRFVCRLVSDMIYRGGNLEKSASETTLRMLDTNFID